MSWSVSIIEPPVLLPITLDEARQQLGIVDELDDVAVENLIRDAAGAIERAIDGPLMAQVRALHLDAFPAGVISLPTGAISEVIGVSYIASDGAVIDLDTPSQWQARILGARTMVLPQGAWPTIAASPGVVTVTYACGYADGDVVPPDLRRAVKLLVSRFNDDRAGEIEPGGALATLVRPWRAVSV